MRAAPDVWVAVDPKNASLITSALKDFGFAVSELGPELFLRADRVIRMGVAPNRIEIQTGIDGGVSPIVTPTL